MSVAIVSAIKVTEVNGCISVWLIDFQYRRLERSYRVWGGYVHLSVSGTCTAQAKRSRNGVWCGVPVNFPFDIMIKGSTVKESRRSPLSC